MSGDAKNTKQNTFSFRYEWILTSEILYFGGKHPFSRFCKLKGIGSIRSETVQFPVQCNGNWAVHLSAIVLNSIVDCAMCVVFNKHCLCAVHCAVMEGHKGDTLARPRISHSHEYTIAPTFHPDASHTKCNLFAISICFATQEEALIIIFDSNIRKTKQTSYIAKCVSISTSQPSEW